MEGVIDVTVVDHNHILFPVVPRVPEVPGIPGVPGFPGVPGVSSIFFLLCSHNNMLKMWGCIRC